MRIDRRLTVALLCGVAGQASALNLQFKPSAHAAVEHDDNVFRVSDEAASTSVPKVSDTLTTVGGAARLTLNHSLQTLEVRGEYDNFRYRQLEQLDYERKLVGAQARLGYASRLRLKLDAGRERRQEAFAFRDDTSNSFITVDQASAELRAEVTPRWTAIARGDRYRTSASRIASQDYDLTENIGELGIEYRRSGLSSLELGLRRAEGEYPKRIVTPGDGREKDYDQQSVVARIGYTPSGLSSLSAQLAYTERRHDDTAVSDFRGVTGRASLTRRFSGISQARLEVYRDLFYVEDRNANYVENLGAKASFDYRWSVKLAFAVAAERYSSSYQASPGFDVAGRPREDQVFNIRAGFDYQPFYRFSILPEYRYERRGSRDTNSQYDYNVFGVDFAYEYGLRTRR
ncbi:MAG: outer membrane beta-barrel protein [Pseudomonadota bacterium]